MHKEIFSVEQLALLDFLGEYNKKYYLVGGTAIALHLGHRKSIDFDLFTFKRLERIKIKKRIAESRFFNNLIVELDDQIHYNINGVKLTFFQFPYAVQAKVKFENFFMMPDLLTLAAMKAFALGGRGKWKDYVDLYFILRDHFSIDEVASKAKSIFENAFNPNLFRKQICFFTDVSYSEAVEYLPGFETDDQTIKDFLIDVAISV
jgi:hypothetical protein